MQAMVQATWLWYPVTSVRNVANVKYMSKEYLCTVHYNSFLHTDTAIDRNITQSEQSCDSRKQPSKFFVPFTGCTAIHCSICCGLDGVCDWICQIPPVVRKD